MTIAESDQELIDQIAGALPVEIRAAYYRELTYCQSLPENDEILRVLRAMQFLTLLMVQVPQRVLVERGQLERLFGSAMESLRQTIQSSEAFHRQLEDRLAGLPKEVARGLSPPAIVREINESLRQQFVQSTIPETAHALAVIADEMKKTTGGFAQAARAIGDIHRSAAGQARKAIDDLQSTISHAADTARRSAVELSTSFQREFQWTLYALSGLALVIGLVLGALYQRWIDEPQAAPKAADAPAAQPAPQVRSRTR